MGNKVNLLEHTSRVSFELSNRCNYAHVHKHCPLYLKRNDPPVILMTGLILEVIEYLDKNRFKGSISFHTYNEPLMDPRPFILLLFALERRLNVMILTNGYYLNQDIAEDLKDSGTTELIVSAYSDAEEERLKKIKVDIPYKVVRRKLDDRLDMYTKPEVKCNKPCGAPLNEIIIGCDGKVRLCCLDWDSKYTFGNLYEKPLEEILKDPCLQGMYGLLSSGKRDLDICKRCGSSR
jgi:MoaA/NifB/PqqE/SkfB family radical SAM enzyme